MLIMLGCLVILLRIIWPHCVHPREMPYRYFESRPWWPTYDGIWALVTMAQSSLRNNQFDFETLDNLQINFRRIHIIYLRSHFLLLFDTKTNFKNPKLETLEIIWDESTHTYRIGFSCCMDERFAHIRYFPISPWQWPWQWASINGKPGR